MCSTRSTCSASQKDKDCNEPPTAYYGSLIVMWMTPATNPFEPYHIISYDLVVPCSISYHLVLSNFALSHPLQSLLSSCPNPHSIAKARIIAYHTHII